MQSPQSYRLSARLTNGLTDTWLQLLSSFELSSEKEFTAEKTLFQFNFGLASGLLFFLNGFTECSCTMIVAIDQEAFKNDV